MVRESHLLNNRPGDIESKTSKNGYNTKPNTKNPS